MDKSHLVVGKAVVEVEPHSEGAGGSSKRNWHPAGEDGCTRRQW